MAMQTFDTNKSLETGIRDRSVKEPGMPGISQGPKKLVSKAHDAEIWVIHGEELMHCGETAKAIECFDKAISGAPQSAKAYTSKADALESMGKFEDAIRNYDLALSHDPLNAECWYNKGITLKKLGRDQEASLCINHSLNISMGI
jgi:tetratricopeptide (TPR) repeat protein